MRVVAYQEGHLDRISFGQFESHILDGMALKEPPSLTLVDNDGVPFACGGFHEVTDTIAECWFVASDALRSRPHQMHGAAARAIAGAQKVWPLLRARVRQVQPARAHRWMLLLGFVKVSEDDWFVFYERGRE